MFVFSQSESSLFILIQFISIHNFYYVHAFPPFYTPEVKLRTYYGTASVRLFVRPSARLSVRAYRRALVGYQNT